MPPTTERILFLEIGTRPRPSTTRRGRQRATFSGQALILRLSGPRGFVKRKRHHYEIVMFGKQPRNRPLRPPAALLLADSPASATPTPGIAAREGETAGAQQKGRRRLPAADGGSVRPMRAFELSGAYDPQQPVLQPPEKSPQLSQQDDSQQEGAQQAGLQQRCILWHRLLKGRQQRGLQQAGSQQLGSQQLD